MKYEVRLTTKAESDLLVFEQSIQKRITRKLQFFAISKNPLNYAKKLKRSHLGTYRFRIGDYRAIFDIDKKGNINILLILRIKHRREVYDK